MEINEEAIYENEGCLNEIAIECLQISTIDIPGVSCSNDEISEEVAVGNVALKNDTLDGYFSRDKRSEDVIPVEGIARMKSPVKIIQGYYTEGVKCRRKPFNSAGLVGLTTLKYSIILDSCLIRFQTVICTYLMVEYPGEGYRQSH